MEQLEKPKHRVSLYPTTPKESKCFFQKTISSKTSIFFSIHLKQEEKLTIRCGRDGGVENLEVHGMIMLRVKSEEYGRILVAIDNKETRNIQLQVRQNFFNI